MSTPPEPDWDLLPDQPQAFFELEDGHSRTDLKRAYTRWIKRFKPERYPQEFQRIRSAFEFLEGLLRHGGTGAPRPAAPAPWPAQPSAERAPSPEPGPGPAPPQPSPPQIDALAVLEEQGPAALAKALREHRHKSPRAWVQFALLEEELSGDPLAAIQQLLAGIVATGRPNELYPVLWGLLRDPRPAAEAARLVHELSEATDPIEPEGVPAQGPGSGAIPAASYWHLTEQLWIELARGLSSDQALRLMQRCARRVGPGGEAGRLMVCLRLMRTAAPTASAEWLDSMRADLLEHVTEFHPDVRDELDLTLWLHEALDARAELDATREPGPLLDSALMAILAGEEVAADRAFLEAMVWIGDHRAEHLAQLPPDHILPIGVTGPLDYWASELDGRSAEKPSLGATTAKRRVVELLQRIERRTDRHWLGRVWGLISFAFMGLFFALLIVPWATAGHFELTDNGPVLLACAGWTILMAGAYFRGLPARLLGRCWRPFAQRLYRDLWRNMVADFLAETPLPIEAFLHHCSQVDSPGITNQYHLVLNVDGDSGLELYALARRFL